MKRHLLFLVGLSASCTLTHRPNAADEEYFLSQVKPVLQEHCLRCHSGTMHPPALNLSNRDTAFTRSASGQDYIQPGSPDRSLLITAIGRIGTHPKLMPQTDLSLTDDQIGMLREWIEDGAVWPAGPLGQLHPQATKELP